MVLQSSIEKKKLPNESAKISLLLKEVVQLYEPTAQVILFGSKARGDAGDESDWDFLILTEKNNTDLVLRDLIHQVVEKIELVYLVAISLLVKNKSDWEEQYVFYNIYESIKEEGIAL